MGSQINSSGLFWQILNIHYIWHWAVSFYMHWIPVCFKRVSNGYCINLFKSVVKDVLTCLCQKVGTQPWMHLLKWWHQLYTPINAQIAEKRTNLWSELKRGVHILKPKCIKELDMLSTKAWTKLFVTNASKLISHYRKGRDTVILSKKGLIKY